ncbi:unnamed protein product [Larinioides sclopetarius]|uniref:Ribosomal protein S13 n=1 Tax=Larinioides sclopetarius TaxID=280406 RepID=A0AAV1ZCW5_9ARAC
MFIIFLNVFGSRINAIYYCRKNLKELGNDGRRPGSGQKRTVNASNNRKAIKK